MIVGALLVIVASGLQILSAPSLWGAGIALLGSALILVDVVRRRRSLGGGRRVAAVLVGTGAAVGTFAAVLYVLITA